MVVKNLTRVCPGWGVGHEESGGALEVLIRFSSLFDAISIRLSAL